MHIIYPLLLLQGFGNPQQIDIYIAVNNFHKQKINTAYRCTSSHDKLIFYPTWHSHEL